MRILIVGSDEVWSLERIFLKELKKYAEVDLFDLQGRFLNHYRKSVIHKIKYRLGISKVLHKVNQDLLDYCEANPADIIWVFKGMELFPGTLEVLKKKGFKLINYNPDHPIRSFSRGSGSKYVQRSIGIYDLHLTYSQAIEGELKQGFSVDTGWIPFAYEVAMPNPISDLTPKICFIGNPDRERADMISFLASRGIKVDVYGIGWHRFIKGNSDKIQLFPPVFKEDFIKTAQKYWAHLNILRPHNEHSHNMRTFELPAIGCLMLANRTPEHLAFFSEGKEAEYFDDKLELLKKVQMLIELPVERIKQYQQAAYERSINSDYSYSKRAMKVFESCRLLIQD